MAELRSLSESALLALKLLYGEHRVNLAGLKGESYINVTETVRTSLLLRELVRPHDYPPRLTKRGVEYAETLFHDYGDSRVKEARKAHERFEFLETRKADIDALICQLLPGENFQSGNNGKELGVSFKKNMTTTVNIHTSQGEYLIAVNSATLKSPEDIREHTQRLEHMLTIVEALKQIQNKLPQ